MTDNPCYNRKTGTDCPNRCPGCKIGCSKWAEYEAERNKRYELRRNCFGTIASADYEYNKKYWRGELKKRG